MNVINLTRSFIPKVSAVKAENIKAINQIPEQVLTKLIANGDKTIQQVGMNESKAVRILQNSTKTIFTDGLNGCNAFQVVAKGLDGNPITIMSHYTPLSTSRTLNQQALSKQLQTYDYYIDKAQKPSVFFNVASKEVNGKQVSTDNPIISQLKSVLNKFFKQGYDEKIIPYEAVNKTPFDSKAMISQFNKTSSGWDMKLTTVGEKEHFIKLWG